MYAGDRDRVLADLPIRLKDGEPVDVGLADEHTVEGFHMVPGKPSECQRGRHLAHIRENYGNEKPINCMDLI
jgi:hypothetical protein